jgi:hypothetical protein
MDNEFEDKPKEMEPGTQPESNPEEATGLQAESSLIYPKVSKLFCARKISRWTTNLKTNKKK